MDGQALWSEEAVVQQPRQVERAGVVTGHVRVAQHEIHVVDGVDPAEERPQLAQPVGSPLELLSNPRTPDQPGHLPRIQFLQRLQLPVGIPPHSTNQLAQLLLDDLCTQVLVSEFEVGQEMVVEEVPEGTVADIVQQRRQPHQALDTRPRWDVVARSH